jgi:hypothetical protein
VKITTLVGVSSLVLNVALLGVIAVGAFSAAPESARISQRETAGDVAQPAARTGLPTWSDLDSEDLSLQRDRLQSEGFPPAAVRAILSARIRESFAAQRKAAEAAAPNAPFWKDSVADPRVQAVLRAIAQEEQKAIRALLGPDPENGPAARLRQQFPDFSSDKIDQLVAIRERYDEQRQALLGFARGQYTPSEREKMAALEKAMHAEFAAVLTPEELENYDLRTSNTANSLRHRLSTFEATEAEFRSLFQLQRAFDQEHAYTGPSDPEQSRLRSEAHRRLQDQIAATLGPTRYADYQRSTDYNFQQANLLVSRLGLPENTALSLYEVQKEFEGRRDGIYRETASTSREQLPEQMTALHQEAMAKVSAVLGGNTTAVDAYKLYGGAWLMNFVPRPAPSAKR